ncbi:MAG: GNAT family N-acetyltransferase [Paracoccaceae bacterium]|uniref:GNAT family N-acetyltransferase n=1 Tax=Seohaeicola saemankumensis TaxID=481181 RepID=UPI001E41D09F|nr:GNAT family protein [Seohaeicola saemankumensis]MCD1626528.1 GNAT family N-acetyltransferase [Seohaeicola saemankumensis]
MRVTLAPLRLTDFPLVAAINVRADQILFSGSVREVFENPAPDVDVDVLAINSDDAPVGLFRIDTGYTAAYGFALQGDLGLRTVMIDAARQGKGIGTSAMRALPAFLHETYP